MRRKIKIIGLVLLLTPIALALLAFIVYLVVPTILYHSSPWGRPNEEIREMLIEITPIGMHLDDVLQVIEDNEEWERNLNRNLDAGWFDGSMPISDQNPVIGSKTVVAKLGRAGYAHIYANWIFDENSELIEIVARNVGGWRLW